MSTPDHASPEGSAVRNTQYASPRTLEIIAVTLVLLLAAYLRLNHLDWTEFKQDEARLSQIAYDMARTGEIPLRSIGASTGVVNLPLAAWLLAIPYAVSGSPIVATAFLAGLNVLAVACCYTMARSWFKSWSDQYVLGALAAALLFAVAPWAIVYSRKLWANDFLPLLVIGWAWTGWLTFVQKKPWWLIAHAALLGACIQLHYSALMLAPVSAVWFVAFIKRASWRAVLIAVVVFVLLFAPFLIADAERGSPNVTRFVALFQQPSTTDTSAVNNAWLLATGLEIHSLAGPQEFENFRALVPWSDGMSWLVGLLVIAGLIIAAIDVLRAVPRRKWDDRSAVALLLTTWLLIPIIGQLSHRTPLFVHYFLPILPAPFVVVGYWVARVTLTPALSLSKRGSAFFASADRDHRPCASGSDDHAATVRRITAHARRDGHSDWLLRAYRAAGQSSAAAKRRNGDHRQHARIECELRRISSHLQLPVERSAASLRRRGSVGARASGAFAYPDRLCPR